MIVERRLSPALPLALLLVAVAGPGTTAVAQESQANDAATTAVQQNEQVTGTETDVPSALTDPKEAELDAQAAEVASQLKCLVCRNQSVLESNSELSREMQTLIRERLAAGETPDEVKAYFVSRYGEFILLQPPARGINLLVYALPVVVLLLGFFVARNRLRKWADDGTAPVPEGDAEALATEDEEWLRAALREG